MTGAREDVADVTQYRIGDSVRMAIGNRYRTPPVTSEVHAAMQSIWEANDIWDAAWEATEDTYGCL